MDIPSLGTWGMLGNYVPLASCVTVATPCWGFEAQHGYRVGRTWSDLQSLVIPCFFFLSFYYSSDSSFFLKEELTLLSRAPDSSGSDSSAISSLCVFGLVDI